MIESNLKYATGRPGQKHRVDRQRPLLSESTMKLCYRYITFFTIAISGFWLYIAYRRPDLAYLAFWLIFMIIPFVAATFSVRLYPLLPGTGSKSIVVISTYSISSTIVALIVLSGEAGRYGRLAGEYLLMVVITMFLYVCVLSTLIVATVQVLYHSFSNRKKKPPTHK